MKCEICGREIRGRPIKIIIDRAELIVCKECAKHGTPVLSHEIKSVKPSKQKIVKQQVKKRSRALPFEDLEFIENYNAKIKEKRESLGLTIADLAKTIKEKESLLRKIESGKIAPTLDVAKKLEKALGIKILVRESFEGSAMMGERKSKDITLGDIIEFKRKNDKRK